MTALQDRPLTSPEAWLGVWIRGRSGPLEKATVRRGIVDVTVWHRIGSVSRLDRLQTACGYGPRNGFTWPSGGGRMEIARPHSLAAAATLPGEVCWRCMRQPERNDEEATLPDVLLDEIDMDALAEKVAERMKEKP